MRPSIIIAFTLAGASLPAFAQETAPQRPEVLNRLTACRSVTAAAERLACYDRQVAALEAAEAAREIAVVDRQQIRRPRRSRFAAMKKIATSFASSDGCTPMPPTPNHRRAPLTGALK